MHHAPNFLVTTDNRVQLSLAGQSCEIAAVLLQGLVGSFGVLAGDSLVASDLLQGGKEALPGDVQPLEELGLLRDGQQHVLDAEVFVVEPLHLGFGTGQDLGEPLGDVDLSGGGAGPLHLGELGQGLFGSLANGCVGYSGLLKDRAGDSAFLVQEGEEKMLDVNTLVASTHGMSGRRLEGVLQLQGHAVHIHKFAPRSRLKVVKSESRKSLLRPYHSHTFQLSDVPFLIII